MNVLLVKQTVLIKLVNEKNWYPVLLILPEDLMTAAKSILATSLINDAFGNCLPFAVNVCLLTSPALLSLGAMRNKEDSMSNSNNRIFQR